MNSECDAFLSFLIAYVVSIGTTKLFTSLVHNKYVRILILLQYVSRVFVSLSTFFLLKYCFSSLFYYPRMRITLFLGLTLSAFSASRRHVNKLPFTRFHQIFKIRHICTHRYIHNMSVCVLFITVYQSRYYNAIITAQEVHVPYSRDEPHSNFLCRTYYRTIYH